MKTALGRGLEALLPERGEEVVQIDIGKIRPSGDQPRKRFDDGSIEDLTQSIREKGILQPVIVSSVGDGTFQLIAGERRWRAATRAGLKTIPAFIKDVSSQDAIEIALIENIQREDLNPIETAEAFQRLVSDYGMTQENLSARVGKDRATVANYIRILRLPEEVRTLINEDRLSIGHAKVILSLEGQKRQIDAAREIVKRALSVRAAETFCRKFTGGKTKTRPGKTPEVEDLEQRLTRSLGTKVRVHHGKKRGRIEIEYYSLDELDRLLDHLFKLDSA